MTVHSSGVVRLSEKLVLVDRDDNPVGAGEKVSCHLPNGRLHRAFTVLLFDHAGRLLLARRSGRKMLWPGCWDGTVASHPRESETFISSAERRMPEELGVWCELEYLFKFEYHVSYGKIGSENEICGTMIGVIDPSIVFKPIPDEISEVRWSSVHDLLASIRDEPMAHCPWMLIALYLIHKADAATLERHGFLKAWAENGTRAALKRSIQMHLPDDRWEIKYE